ncbi:cobalamin-binding protein [Halalkalibacter krulwichiae]|uniref:Vitamin B12-binding protein n=1 Tax=Halalkalibacter krulwichiae TaxID=199441 RepID=A0A1X9MGZ8_9BACI|nr:cobalamin-binding protein [Halalkalibacter krulwichiae]ARK31904.1 Vitamin B12-binding protein precursor [Halalkalibacter krulwichiae]
MRIVSICPSNTELLAYLNLLPQLIAVDDFSDWPKVVHGLPRLGPDLSIRMDELEAMEPDLVIASLSVPGMEKNVDELIKRGIPHVVYNPNSLTDIRDNLLDLGKRTNKEQEAFEITEAYDRFIYTYREKSKLVTKKSLYWEWWPKPVFTPGAKNWLTEISQLAGGRNVYDHVDLASVQTDWQDVYDHNPDHVCLAWVGVHTKKVKPNILWKRPNWSNLKALQTNQVHVLEEELYCRPSPRLLLGLQKLASLLHPDVMPNDDGLDPLLDATIKKEE